MRKTPESLANFSPYDVDETAFDSLVRDPMQGVRDCMELGKTALKKISAMVASATIGMAPVAAIPFPNLERENLQVASIAVINDGHVQKKCPPNSQVSILDIAGVGMTITSDLAAKQTEKILGTRYNAVCEAALRNGEEGYTPTYYAELLHEFVEANDLNYVVIFAHSFGGITAVDIVNIYSRLYPASNTQFAVTFFSAPSGPEDLQVGSWLGAELHKPRPLDKKIIFVETYLGIISQGINPISVQPIIDAANNAAATPPILTQQQSKRVLDGMSKLTPEACERIKSFGYIGDKNDSIVKNEQAPYNIAKASGRPMNSIEHIEYTDSTMSNHAGLWAEKYIEVHRYAVASEVVNAFDALGITGSQPVKNHIRATRAGLFHIQ